jgi:hypothetical protein
LGISLDIELRTAFGVALNSYRTRYQMSNVKVGDRVRVKGDEYEVISSGSANIVSSGGIYQFIASGGAGGSGQTVTAPNDEVKFCNEPATVRRIECDMGCHAVGEIHVATCKAYNPNRVVKF